MNPVGIGVNGTLRVTLGVAPVVVIDNRQTLADTAFIGGQMRFYQRGQNLREADHCGGVSPSRHDAESNGNPSL